MAYELQPKRREPWFRPAVMIDSGPTRAQGCFWWFKRTESCQGGGAACGSCRQKINVSCLQLVLCMDGCGHGAQNASIMSPWRQQQTPSSTIVLCRLNGPADALLTC